MLIDHYIEMSLHEFGAWEHHSKDDFVSCKLAAEVWACDLDLGTVLHPYCTNWNPCVMSFVVCFGT